MELTNEKVTKYLDDTCSLIKNKRVHSEVKKELKNHIDKLIKHYEDLKHTKSESVKLALLDMGSSQKLGRELNETHKPKVDYKLIITLVILFFTGLLGTMSFMKIYKFQTSNLYYLPIAIIAFLVASKINFKWYKKLAIPFYILAIISIIPIPYIGFILTDIPFIGEFTLLLLAHPTLLFLFGLSGIYLKFNFKNMKSISLAIFLGILPLILLVIISFVNSNKETYRIDYFRSFPVILSFISYSIALLFILYFASKSFKIVITTAILEIIILATSLFNVVKDLIFYNDGGNYLSINTILKSSKFINFTHNANGTNVAYPNSAYALTNLIAYAGWLFGIIAILVLLYFVFRLYKTSKSINNTFGKSLAFIISTTIAVRVIVGILLNLNLFPYIQMSIPLISYTGIELITTVLLLGVLTNIYKVKNLAKI